MGQLGPMPLSPLVQVPVDKIALLKQNCSGSEITEPDEYMMEVAEISLKKKTLGGVTFLLSICRLYSIHVLLHNFPI